MRSTLSLTFLAGALLCAAAAYQFKRPAGPLYVCPTGEQVFRTSECRASRPAGPLYVCPSDGRQVFYTRDCAAAEKTPTGAAAR